MLNYSFHTRGHFGYHQWFKCKDFTFELFCVLVEHLKFGWLDKNSLGIKIKPPSFPLAPWMYHYFNTYAFLATNFTKTLAPHFLCKWLGILVFVFHKCNNKCKDTYGYFYCISFISCTFCWCSILFFLFKCDRLSCNNEGIKL
jgi:hypothetical protein